MTVIEPSSPRGYSIFCDEVRREDNGKFIHLGVYLGEMIINAPALPARLPRLSVIVNYYENIGQSTEPVFFRVFLPGEDKPAGAGDIKQATHGDEDHPLTIGDIKIACYVLEDGRRVLQQTGLIQSLNMSHGGSYSTGGDRLAKFATQGRLSSFVSNELIERTANPIRFRTPKGSLAYGYEATILADLCDAILAARAEGILQKQQQHIAERAEILVRGFARVGIIALVDEATGFQRDRAKNALAQILEAFVAKELQPWVKTFPDEYYAQLFRLRGLDYPNDSVKRPQYFGTLTNDIVYKRLAPGVLAELKKVIPKGETGRRKGSLSQGLTRNVGYPKLREHLGASVAFMKISRDYHDFIEKMDTHYPRYGEQYRLPFNYEPDQDDGKGL